MSIASSWFAEKRVPSPFSLAVPADARKALATGWLLLAIGALLASGVFSVLLVLFGVSCADRKSVVEGKSVDLGVRRIIKKVDDLYL